MKNYLTYLVALVAAIMSSCTNEDIEIINYSDFKLNISTQSVYDDFDIAESFKNRFLGGKGYSIGVYSFIYGENGHLEASDSTYVDVFGRVTQNFNLAAGSYTIITLEMIVENDNKYESPNWVIIDKENLETIKIVNKNYTSYWYSAVGLNTSIINIGKGEYSKDITPKGIGVIVDTRITNFDLSDYACVNFFTKEQPSGRLLSPSYIGEERMVYDHYNGSNEWTPRGFTYNPSGLNKLEQPTIYLLEEGEVRYCFGAEKMNDDGSLDSSFFAFPSSNSKFPMVDGSRYYGGFNFSGGTPGNDCEAGMFNSLAEYSSWYDEIIKDMSAYANPYLEWGASASSVDAYMKKEAMVFEDSGISTEYGIYWSSYTNHKKSVYYEYQFDINKENLNGVFMFFDTSSFTIESIKSDLSKIYEGGEFIDDLKGYLYYSDRTLLLLNNDPTNGYLQVYYVPNSSNDSSMRQIVKTSLKLNSSKQFHK